MKLIKTRGKRQAVKKACSIFIELVKKKPNAVLGLATGGTMIPFYKQIVKQYKKQKLDFSNLKTFNLDEYAGLSSSNKKSYHYYMNKNFFSKVNVKKQNIHFPSESAIEGKYDQQVTKSGGMDLCILGIGQNGHIAFNEPGSSFNSKTRKIRLTENTINANSRFFKSRKEVPREAYTMGISTIMKAKKIILLAFGTKKTDAISHTVQEKISEQIPASILRMHKDATLILDSNAARRLQ